MTTLYGDVFGSNGALFGKQKGQHQILVGTGNQDNTIFGDAYTIQDRATGGNDILIGGDGSFGLISNYLYGDAYQMLGSTHGGFNELIGGDGLSGGGPFATTFMAIPTKCPAHHRAATMTL